MLEPQAVDLITRCLQVEPSARPTVEEVLGDPYFTDCPTECPELNEEEQKLRTYIDDLIKRHNVHEYDGRETFEAKYAEQITSQIHMDPELLEHYRKLAILFLFNEDPDHEELEAEKDLVQAESKAAWSRAAERMAEDEANHPLQEQSSESD